MLRHLFFATKSILLVALFAAVVVISNQNASADVVSDFLTFDGPVHHTQPPFQGGGEDKLQDDSLSAWMDIDNSGSFSIGDQFISMVTLSEINSSGRPSRGVGANSQIALLSMYQISGMGSGGSFSHSPVVGGLAGLLDPSISGAAGLNANSLGVVMWTNTPDTNAVDDPLNWTLAQISNGATGFGAANGWNWSMTVGLTPGSGDFLETLAFGPSGLQRGGFTVQSSAFGASWLSVDVLDFGGATHLNDVTLDFASFATASGVEQARGWSFRDQGTYYVNAVPEPSSVVVLLMGSMLMVVRRRKS